MCNQHDCLHLYLIPTGCVHVNTVKVVNRDSFSGNEGRNVNSKTFSLQIKSNIRYYTNMGVSNATTSQVRTTS